ncbi:hypothetical protein P170DRAFT_439267 [Aspergillus steynii IBT 23096]|uniref:Uncharacterized protein n=1 Tax=Aspergillus steynii IBT 23096 TaxID=1392250 RepID=A0A2I2FY09_9EURO|nr:uncharacterized protein P170DRAFT_439267 [Aspergillus steynii IBT 23096]PLB45517.1 hypothetical protein P170DRAFT_439267 [Aspergillus steynii IBT 23096]
MSSWRSELVNIHRGTETPAPDWPEEKEKGTGPRNSWTPDKRRLHPSYQWILCWIYGVV